MRKPLSGEAGEHFLQGSSGSSASLSTEAGAQAGVSVRRNASTSDVAQAAEPTGRTLRQSSTLGIPWLLLAIMVVLGVVVAGLIVSLYAQGGELIIWRTAEVRDGVETGQKLPRKAGTGTDPVIPKWKAYVDESQKKLQHFCQIAEALPENPGHTLVSHGLIQPMKMFVLSSNDIVSNEIMRGGWDVRKVNDMLKKYEEVQQVRKVKKEDLFMIDIGANIGWFTFIFAAHGVKVLAFEAMPQNHVVMMKTMCLNPEQAKLVELHQSALGAQTGKCVMFSIPSNQANGNIKCMSEEERAVWKVPDGFIVRSNTTITKLDDIIGGRELNVALLKIDTEGYEGWIIEGARKTLERLQIPYVYSEFSNWMIRERGFEPGRVLEMWDELGYIVLRDCFNPGSVIRIDVEGRKNCKGDKECEANTEHYRFANSQQASLIDICCILRSYTDELQRFKDGK